MNILRKNLPVSIVFFTLFLLTSVRVSYALDWRNFHQIASHISIQEALESISENPKSIERLYTAGVVYLNKHEYAKAEEIFQKILVLNPHIVEAQWGIAEVYRNQHKYAQSIEILEDVLKKYPEFAPALNTLGYIRYIRMAFSESIKLTGEVIDMGANRVDLLTLVQAHGIYAAARGMLAQYGGPLSKSFNFFAVKRHLSIVKELMPESLVVYFGYGSFYMSIPKILGQDLAKAEDFLQKAILVDPKFAEAYVRLAQIYKYKGDEEKFNQYLNKALEIDPQNELAQDMQRGICKFICLE